MKTDKVILAIEPNSHKLIEHKQEILIQHIDAVKKGHISVKEQEKSSGKVSLSEAEVIVSAGRGLKGPENWNMIEELADLLIKNGTIPIFHRFTTFEAQSSWVKKYQNNMFISCGLRNIDNTRSLLDLGAYGTCIDVAHGHSEKICHFITDLKRTHPKMVH